MSMIWWIIIAAILGVAAAFIDRHFENKRMKKHEEICEGVNTQIRKTIETLDRLNKKS